MVVDLGELGNFAAKWRDRDLGVRTRDCEEGLLIEGRGDLGLLF